MNSRSALRLGTAVRLVMLTAATLGVLAVQTARAAGEAEEFRQIIELVSQGDSLIEKGQAEAAKAKYREAQLELVRFKQENSSWNVNLVTHRLEYVSEKLGTPAPTVVARSPRATVASADSSTEAAVPAEFKMISEGSEPRVALRFHPKAGDKQTATLNLTISMDLGGVAGMGGMGGRGGGGRGGMGGMQMMSIPTIKIGMETEVLEVSGDGDISFATVLGEAEIESQDDNSPMGGMIAGGLGSIKGTKINGQVNSRGVSKVAQVEAPQMGNRGGMMGSMGQVQDFIGQALLPEPPVGVGAKWQVVRQVKSQGTDVTQTETYEVVSISGDVVALKTSTKQNAGEQQVGNQGMGNFQMNVTKVESKSSGSTTFDLTKMLPVASELESTSETVMSLDMGGEKRDITSKSGMKLKIESK